MKEQRPHSQLSARIGRTWQQFQRGPIARLSLIVLASVIMSVNIKSFVNAGGLFPGGFNGLTLLIQRSAEQFAGISLPPGRSWPRRTAWRRHRPCRRWWPGR